MQPVQSHTAKSLLKFLKETLAKFFGDGTRSVKLFNTTDDTTDGAANMIKLSTILDHERNTCVAHYLQNLLTVDTLNKMDDVQQLITRYKEVVKAEHFKSYMLDKEKMREDNKI